jgi:DNA-binding LacI/PurR family transcriptional regulator
MVIRNKITLKKIATELGVTPATVSKALHDSSDISSAMKEKVKKTAEKMGYRPNILARILLQRRSHLLGVIVPDLHISFFSETSRGIYEQARLRGYESILMVHDENPISEKKNLEFLSDLHVDGIVLDPAPGNYNYDLYSKLIKEGIKIVCYDRKLNDYDFPSVTIDDRASANKLTTEILNMGRKNILFIGPIKDLYLAIERYNGYLDALKSHKIKVNKELVVNSDLSEASGYNKMCAVLSKGIKPDAVIGVGALVSYGAGRAILEAGLSIPNDIVLGEFGDNDINARLGVPFITINQNPYQIGQNAVDLLIQNIESSSKNMPVEHIIIETKLIHRQYGAYQKTR